MPQQGSQRKGAQRSWTREAVLTAVLLPIDTLEIVPEPRRVSFQRAKTVFVRRTTVDVVQRQEAVVQNPADITI